MHIERSLGYGFGEGCIFSFGFNKVARRVDPEPWSE